MKNPIARLYNFQGKLSRRDFLLYWLWVYLLPIIWCTFAGVSIGVLIFGFDVAQGAIAGSVALSIAIYLLLVSLFLGAIWRRLNDIGFAFCPKLIICLLMFILPPYGWILQLIMLLLPSRTQR